MEILRFEEAKRQTFKRFKSSGSTLFNTSKSADGGLNLNQMVGDEEEEVVLEVRPMGRDKAKKKASKASILSTSSATGNDEALTRPAILYGSEFWAITKAQANKVRVTELRMLRIREGRLRWFGHVTMRLQSTSVRRVKALIFDGLRRR
ncbi:hypothetical protein Tco_1101966, partial [Tanacetum coccineum]